MKKLLSIIFLLLVSVFAINVSAASWVTPIPNAVIPASPIAIIHDSDLSASGTGSNAGDADGDSSLSFDVTEEDPAKVDCIKNGNALSLKPAIGFSGLASCKINATDGSGTVVSLFTITVQDILEITGDSILDNTLIIGTPKDYDDEIKLNLDNIGTATLNFPTQVIQPFAIQDENGDSITISVSNLPASLAPESPPYVLTLKFDVDRKVDIGTYDGKLTISAQEGSKELGIRVDVSPEDVCQDGRRGDGRYITSNSVGTLRITDFDVDPDDEFGPGEIIEIRNVEVENEWDDDINDVIVEAILYNVDQDEIIARAESDPEDVDEGDRVDFNDFELEVSSNDKDLDESDTYIIYLQAFEDGNEDEHCNYEFIDNIDFKREADDVDVISATATPSTVMCNANVNFVVTVQNVGDRDQDFVSVKLLDNSLDLDFESDPFSLDQFDDKDDTAVVTYTHKIPASTDSGSYNIEAIVVFNRGRETDSQFVPLKVECGDGSGTLSGSVSISLVQDSVTALQGKLFGLPFKLTNNADEVQTYVVDVSPSGNWADKPQPQTVTLQPGQETTLYTYLTPKADTSSGSYNVEITAKQDNVVLATKTIAVQVGQGTSGTPTGSTTYQPSVTASSVWRNLSGSVAFWIIAIIIVFTLIIYILTILLRPK